MNFTKNDFIELLSILDKIKIESITDLTREEKELLKQFIDECKKSAQQ